MVRQLAAALILATVSGLAFAQGASEASIDRLFVLTRTEKLLDSVYASMDGIMKQAARQAAGPMPAEDTARLDRMTDEVAKAMHEELTWAKLKPVMSSDEELQGIIAFYESPTGQALLDKMPLLMQKSMGLMQQQMQAMMPRIRAAAEKAAADLKAGKSKGA